MIISKQIMILIFENFEKFKVVFNPKTKMKIWEEVENLMAQELPLPVSHRLRGRERQH